MHERDLNNTVTPNPKLAIDYCGIKMKNPIIAASGTFGNGPEYAGYLDLSNEIGAISVKGLTHKGRHGNPGARIAETPSGVLNCIGLENPGAEHFNPVGTGGQNFGCTVQDGCGNALYAP